MLCANKVLRPPKMVYMSMSILKAMHHYTLNIKVKHDSPRIKFNLNILYNEECYLRIRNVQFLNFLLIYSFIFFFVEYST